ncbi:acetyltransferase [Eisenbergiella tayi]|nr:acetyltransferase [Eisenbergiella tayi]
MIYEGTGLSYDELMQMDLGEYTEAVEAKILYNERVKEKQMEVT